MQTIETMIDINASVDEVWSVLTDFVRYPQWSRFVVGIKGEPEAGTRIEVRLDDGSRPKPMTLRPEVLNATAGQELRWRGVLGAGFLFAGEHYFQLTALPGGGTRLCHGEAFTGVLVPLFKKTLDTRVRSSFHAFNSALQKRAESTRVASA